MPAGQLAHGIWQRETSLGAQFALTTWALDTATELQTKNWGGSYVLVEKRQ
jgi:hypothetical protein